MDRFLELTRQIPPLPEQGPWRFDFDNPNRLFPLAVADSAFHLWSPRDPIAQRGTRILVGVSTWSGYDMALLDKVEAALAHRNGTPIRVDVFNFGEMKDISSRRSFIPDLPDFVQTPVVGVWRDGQLEQSENGFRAIQLVARTFGFEYDEVIATVDQARCTPAK